LHFGCVGEAFWYRADEFSTPESSAFVVDLLLIRGSGGQRKPTVTTAVPSVRRHIRRREPFVRPLFLCARSHGFSFVLARRDQKVPSFDFFTCSGFEKGDSVFAALKVNGERFLKAPKSCENKVRFKAGTAHAILEFHLRWILAPHG
jgi:hypothetical protein